jgi:hypothetical protein
LYFSTIGEDHGTGTGPAGFAGAAGLAGAPVAGAAGLAGGAAAAGLAGAAGFAGAAAGGVASAGFGDGGAVSAGAGERAFSAAGFCCSGGGGVGVLGSSAIFPFGPTFFFPVLPLEDSFFYTGFYTGKLRNSRETFSSNSLLCAASTTDNHFEV